ncbi:hypothetical protein SAMN05216382_1249 [Sphingomonas palmae]|uniref:Haem-binding uptake, Tiki superfamily, ChaN n=1 Tax=Sphingomonas palmae TaxID=1855283 RepID=A0A1H7LIH0_9SPHN|nr:DUF5694 domain-containing protein [Sphingomonas palmae]SEK98782.1 hypothetical protein SAMN05216382_1249 [Sphingomonas palmae]
MKRKWFGAALAALSVGAITSVVAAQGVSFSGNRPALLIVGSPHFGNPGQDIGNTRVENVLTPDRQREIEAVVDRLARFHPNHVAVEWDTADQAKLDKRYADYRAGRYKLTADESDQLGLRLAAKLNLPRVDAVDFQGEKPGKDADYDFVAWMKAHGRSTEWAAFQRQAQAEADANGARQRCSSVGDWLRHYADPDTARRNEAPYYTIARFGDARENPGANWVGQWHARNLKIYANLARVAGRPGDRTVVIFGGGHAPLLRAYASESGTFNVADARDYLPSGPRRRC